MKYLPYNLKHLELHLEDNNLGRIIKNIKHIAGGIRYLPINLSTFKLHLESNHLGGNTVYLRDLMKYLP